MNLGIYNMKYSIWLEAEECTTGEWTPQNCNSDVEIKTRVVKTS